MWNTAIVSEPWLTANSSECCGLTMTCWSASSTPEWVRSAEPLPPVGYCAIRVACRSPSRKRMAMMAFSPGAATLVST